MIYSLRAILWMIYTDVVKLLQHLGYQVVRQRGSHIRPMFEVLCSVFYVLCPRTPLSFSTNLLTSSTLLFTDLGGNHAS